MQFGCTGGRTVWLFCAPPFCIAGWSVWLFCAPQYCIAGWSVLLFCTPPVLYSRYDSFVVLGPPRKWTTGTTVLLFCAPPGNKQPVGQFCCFVPPSSNVLPVALFWSRCNALDMYFLICILENSVFYSVRQIFGLFLRGIVLLKCQCHIVMQCLFDLSFQIVWIIIYPVCFIYSWNLFFVLVKV